MGGQMWGIVLPVVTVYFKELIHIWH